MRILISNDDGYLAPGLAALVRACQGLGVIDVVAPEQNASGTSNALTLSKPLSVFEPRGETIYWIGPAGDPRQEGHDTDFHAVASGHVSITPLQVDLTEHTARPLWARRLGAGLA